MNTHIVVTNETISIKLDKEYDNYLFFLENEGELFRSVINKTDDSIIINYQYPFKTELVAGFLISIQKENSNNYFFNMIKINTENVFDGIVKPKYILDTHIMEKKIIFNGSFYRLV